MIPKNPEQWKKIDKFLMSFNNKDKIAIVYDADPDGLCSAVLINKLIKRLLGRQVNIAFTQRGIHNTVPKKTLEILKKKKITKVIFTDLGVHEDPATIKKLEKQCEILVIDHHQFFSDITSERTVLAMPQLLADDIESPRYPASKIAYDLANRHADIADLSWIAAIGIISDMSSKSWNSFLEKVFEKNKLKKTKKDWFKTDLGKIAGMFFASMSIDEKNSDYCFNLLMKTKQPKDLFKDKKLAKLRREFDKEINRWVRNMSKKAEKHNDLKFVWYEIQPKYRIHSPISTILSIQPKYRDWVVLIVDTSSDMVKISARCQSCRIKVNELVKLGTKGLKYAAGGGHVPAAGANVLKKDLDVFKTRILDKLRKTLYTNKKIK